MKILVLTSVYPQPDDDKQAGVTPVVYYFVKEWVKKGHEVIVIHNSNRFLLPFYYIPKRMVQVINSKVGMVIPKKCQRKYLYNCDNNIKSYRLPITKIIPKGKFLKTQIKAQLKKIHEILDENEFIPDAIIGHWENPQIPLISELKSKYNSRTALVLHGVKYLNKKQYSDWIDEYIPNIDVIGCRSKSIADQAIKELNLEKSPFICYSGIPDEYVEKNKISLDNNEYLENNINSYVYVGQLIEKKNVDTIIEALNNAYDDKNFKLNIVGIGAEQERLVALVERLQLTEQVKFLGRLSREDVVKIMKNSDCFTMVSKDEAFGLVYLEALSCGCLVIASRNEGIDGVIVDNENGFLCESGNVSELTEIYKRIKRLSPDERRRLKSNAMLTAEEFTDSKMATRYLNEVVR